MMRRRPAGAAVVELAISMIVLVPIILYTLFLNDMLLYNLEWQEAVVTPAWDAAPLDFPNMSAPTEGVSKVQGVDRKVFCDHTSAYDSFRPEIDCADDRHHQALAAHQCWLAGGKQITCGVNPDLGDIEPTYLQNFNRGGLVSCTARLGVQNYLIVQRFLNFGKDLTRSTKFEGGVHDNASAANTANSWVFGAQGGASSSGGEPEGDPGQVDLEGESLPSGATRSDDFFAVLHDPWALNYLEKILPDDGQRDGHPLYKRVEHYYYSGNATPEEQPGVDGANQYAKRLQDIGALGAGANGSQDTDAMGDLVMVPNIAFLSGQAIEGEGGGLGEINQSGGGRTIDMAPCMSLGCSRDPYGNMPPGNGVIPPDPDYRPPPRREPGGNDPNRRVGAPRSNYSPSGNTPAQNAALNTKPTTPPANPTAPRNAP